MSPLVAAHVHNNFFCPLGRLLEEDLLCILDFLAEPYPMTDSININIVQRSKYLLSGGSYKEISLRLSGDSIA